METGALVSIQEYLSTSYDPDCDYVDGAVEERNPGEYDHAKLQTAVAAYLYARRKEWGIRAVVEQRVQVSRRGFGCRTFASYSASRKNRFFEHRRSCASRFCPRRTEDGMHEVRELRTEQPEIVVPVSELFG